MRDFTPIFYTTDAKSILKRTKTLSITEQIAKMEKDTKKQERKSRSKNGERTQKMMSFRVDADVASILSTVANKGRLLNNLLREWAQAHPHGEGHDYPPEEDGLDDFMP
jgi:uncharacterized protein (DUF4415 family)